MQRSNNIIRVLARQVHTGPRIYLSKDESCFVSYHPQVEHPYDCTMPLPKAELERKSYLKVDATNMITTAPNMEQLQEITYTHKRHWLNYRGRVKRQNYKAYFDDNVDRKGLTT